MRLIERVEGTAGDLHSLAHLRQCSQSTSCALLGVTRRDTPEVAANSGEWFQVASVAVPECGEDVPEPTPSKGGKARKLRG